MRHCACDVRLCHAAGEKVEAAMSVSCMLRACAVAFIIEARLSIEALISMSLSCMLRASAVAFILEARLSNLLRH